MHGLVISEPPRGRPPPCNSCGQSVSSRPHPFPVLSRNAQLSWGAQELMSSRDHRPRPTLRRRFVCHLFVLLGSVTRVSARAHLERIITKSVALETRIL